MMAKRILIIDDDAALTALCRIVLESLAGFIVHEAHDGVSALATARTFSPDLIFLDCQLPGMSGLAVAAELRSDPALNAVPIVFLTGSEVRFGGTGAWFLNECPVLAKPFSNDQLLRMACAILNSDEHLAA